MPKIIITESQLKRIILSEQKGEHLLYGDNVVDVFYDKSLNLNVIKNGNIIMGYGENAEVIISIRNKSKSTIALNVQTYSDWGNKGERNLKFPKEPLRPNQLEYISFELSNKKSIHGMVVVNLLVSYYIGKQVKQFNVRTIFQKPSSEETINYCKSIFDENQLSYAKQTLLNWLNNPTTFNKYMKNWGLDKNRVNKIFAEYRDVIKKAKLDYTIDPDGENLAYIEPREYNKILKTAAFLPITINCVQDLLQTSIRTNNVQSLLIHEMQHLLNLINPWHPSNKSSNESSSIMSSLFNLVVGNTKSVNVNELKKKLINDGFSEIDALIIAYDHLELIKLGKEKYIKDEDEIASFILGARTFLKIQPGQEITSKQIIDNYDHNQVNWLTHIYIKTGLSLKQFLNLINSYAKNIDLQKNSDLA